MRIKESILQAPLSGQVKRDPETILLPYSLFLGNRAQGKTILQAPLSGQAQRDPETIPCFLSHLYLPKPS